MELLVLLVGCTLLSAIGFYIGEKRVYSPSFLFPGVFALGSLFALIGNVLFWKEDVSFSAPTIILLSLSVFEFAFFIMGKLSFKRKEKPVEINIDDSPSLHFVEGINEKPHLFFAIAIGVFLFGFAINILVFSYEYKIALQYGYVPFNLNFLSIVRNAFLQGVDLPYFVSVLDYSVVGLGLVYTFLVSLLFFGHQKGKFILFSLLPTIPMFSSFLLSTGKIDFILLAISLWCFCFYSAEKSRKTIKISTIVLSLIGVVIFLFALFYLFVALRGDSFVSGSLLESFCIYSGSEIVAFDKWLNSFPKPSLNSPFGSETFAGFYSFFSKFDSTVPSGKSILSFIHFSNASSTNIYTCFESFIADFGLFGNFFVCLMLGFFSSLFYFYLIKKSYISLLIVPFGFFSSMLVCSLFSPLVTSCIFGGIQIVENLASFFFALLLKRLFYPRKKDDNQARKPRVFSSASRMGRSVVYIIFSQLCSIALSAFMALFIPKYFDVENYALWSLFLFYSSFVGVFHFGYCDGVYLEKGGQSSDVIFTRTGKTQFLIFLFSQCLVALVGVCVSFSFLQSQSDRAFILMLTAVYLIGANVFTYFGYIFQACNEMKIYSIGVSIWKLLNLALFAIFLFFHVFNYFYYILAYIFAQFVGAIYLLLKTNKFLVQKKDPFNKQQFIVFWNTTKAGFFLMLGNLSSTLILGIPRYVIDSRWGIDSFAVFSLSVTLMNLIVSFVLQISLVFFPSLRSGGESNLALFFEKGERIIFALVPFIYLVYYPLRLFISSWLPTYSTSLEYLNLIWPIGILDINMNFVFKTILNVNRKEKIFFSLSFAGVLVTLIIGIMGAYLFNNIYVVVFGATVGEIIRVSLTSYYVNRSFDKKPFLEIVPSLFLFAAFSAATCFLSTSLSMIVVLLASPIYYLLRPDYTKEFSLLVKKEISY
jgi:oligosaccharide repeat unit polymerase